MRGVVYGVVALLFLVFSGTASAAGLHCFQGPTRDPSNYWQTYIFVNNCGGPVTVRYTVDRQDGRGPSRGVHFVSACSTSKGLQGFQKYRYSDWQLEWGADAESRICVGGRSADPGQGGAGGIDPDDWGGVTVDPTPQSGGNQLDPGLGQIITDLL